jgi:hypothetical protein
MPLYLFIVVANLFFAPNFNSATGPDYNPVLKRNTELIYNLFRTDRCPSNESKTVIVTDTFKGYNGLSTTYDHLTVKHTENNYVTVGEDHTNSIEGFWSLLKRGIIGIYHNVSPKHLHRYCHEFGYRYNT